MHIRPLTRMHNLSKITINFLSPNDVNITDLVAGKEYLTQILAESAFGRNSTQVTFTRSLYTDIVSLNNTLSTHRLQTEVEFESGVGSTVEMELVCSDFPLSRRRRKVFEYVDKNFDIRDRIIFIFDKFFVKIFENVFNVRADWVGNSWSTLPKLRSQTKNDLGSGCQRRKWPDIWLCFQVRSWSDIIAFDCQILIIPIVS